MCWVIDVPVEQVFEFFADTLLSEAFTKECSYLYAVIFLSLLSGISHFILRYHPHASVVLITTPSCSLWPKTTFERDSLTYV